MTVLDEGLIAYLKNSLSTLVSNRVYGMMIPQKATLPCVTVQRVSTPRSVTMDSAGASGDLISPRFQIDAWATTQKSSKAIADAIRAGLHGHTGTTGTGVTIRAALADEEVPSYEAEVELYRTRSEYIVWQQE
jgi:hypothetical protein